MSRCTHPVPVRGLSMPRYRRCSRQVVEGLPFCTQHSKRQYTAEELDAKYERDSKLRRAIFWAKRGRKP